MSFVGDIPIGAFLLLCIYYGATRGFSVGLFTTMACLAILVFALLEHPRLGVQYESWLAIDTDEAEGFAFATICGVLGVVLIGFRALFRSLSNRGFSNLLNTALGSAVWGALGALLLVLVVMLVFFLTPGKGAETMYNHSAFVRYTFDHLPVARALKEAVQTPQPRRRQEAGSDVIDAFHPKGAPQPNKKPPSSETPSP